MSNILSLLDEIETTLVELYKYKDLNPSSQAKRIKQQTEAQLRRLREVEPENLDSAGSELRARFWYLQGKALNALSVYNVLAEQSLARAVKLQPFLIDGWNCLGEQFWRKNDLQGAYQCFMEAIERENNKVSLRLLSMVLRQMGQDATEKQNNVTESLKKAREALALDIADPFSWYILGNAYLANFFVVSHNSVDIRNALKAYQKSEEQTSLDIRESPDFHYNRSVAFKYNADYQAALEDLVKALELDPGWRELELEIKTLDKFMQHMCALLKGKRRGKKEIATDHGLHGTSTTIKQLVLGSNPTLELCVRVVAIVPSPNPVLPLAAIISDCKGEWVVLSLRSVASGALQTGDNMTISQPILQKCKYEHGQTCFSYDHVVVDDPSHVAVHGKGPLCAAFPVFEMNPK